MLKLCSNVAWHVSTWEVSGLNLYGEGLVCCNLSFASNMPLLLDWEAHSASSWKTPCVQEEADPPELEAARQKLESLNNITADSCKDIAANDSSYEATLESNLERLALQQQEKDEHENENFSDRPQSDLSDRKSTLVHIEEIDDTAEVHPNSKLDSRTETQAREIKTSDNQEEKMHCLSELKREASRNSVSEVESDSREDSLNMFDEHSIDDGKADDVGLPESDSRVMMKSYDDNDEGKCRGFKPSDNGKRGAWRTDEQSSHTPDEQKLPVGESHGKCKFWAFSFYLEKAVHGALWTWSIQFNTQQILNESLTLMICILLVAFQ